MKEKKTISMVVFGVAFVALVIAVIAGLFDSILIFKDSEHLGTTYQEKYNITVGVFELIASILGIVFCVFYILEYFTKDNKWLTICQFVSVIVVLVFFIVAFIVLSEKIPFEEEYDYIYKPDFTYDKVHKGFKYYVQEYTLYVASVNILTKIIIPEIIVFVSYLFIKRIKKMELKQEQKVLEQQPTEQQDTTI